MLKEVLHLRLLMAVPAGHESKTVKINPVLNLLFTISRKS